MFALPGAGEAGAAEDAARVGQLGKLGEAADLGKAADISDFGAVSKSGEAANTPGALADPGAAVSNAGRYPDFNPLDGNTNCGACSDAVYNHLAGLDFRPAETGPRAWPQNAPADSFDFGHTPSSIEQALQGSGSGSRGIVYVADESGNAHVFNVLIEDGNITAIDGQTGVNGSLSDVANHAGYDDASTWGFSQRERGKTMLDLKEARAKAQDLIRRMYPDDVNGEVAVNEQFVSERPRGWVFPFNTKAFLLSRDPRKGLVGNGPVFVDKYSGESFRMPSGGWKQMLDAYDQTGKMPSPSPFLERISPGAAPRALDGLAERLHEIKS